jgi:hypothetical protein
MNGHGDLRRRLLDQRCAGRTAPPGARVDSRPCTATPRRRLKRDGRAVAGRGYASMLNEGIDAGGGWAIYRLTEKRGAEVQVRLVSWAQAFERRIGDLWTG